MFQPTKPISAIIKSGQGDGPKIKSREEWRKEKELEEMRKAGTAPAQVDEEGKDINPHIPQYIATAPWYFGSDGPTLKHQRPNDIKTGTARVSEWYDRGYRGPTATKYRAGACENCGAITHKKKDCLERPRKVGAKYSNTDIAPDESNLPNLKMDYDGKRDRWNGYDPEMYKNVVDEFAKVEEAKRVLKEEKLRQDLINAEERKGQDLVESDSDEEDDKYADHVDMPGTKMDSKERITVRNLRIREDTAKYLRNLDTESAYYDPKTRSMRENPYKNTGKTPEDLDYAGDNFVRFSGLAKEVNQAQLFAWNATENQVDIHLQAEPTKAELLLKEFKVKKEEIKDTVKSSIIEKYGGDEHLVAPPRELIFAQSENYVEYSRSGQIIKGTKKATIRSVFEEDVFINNHSSVWGSFWKSGKWGYKCCKSFIKNSYCLGKSMEPADGATKVIILPPGDSDEEQPVEENEDADARQEAPAEVEDEPPKATEETEPPEEATTSNSQKETQDAERSTESVSKKERKKKKKKRSHHKKKRRHSSSSDSRSRSLESSDDESDDERRKRKKLKKALKEEKKHKRMMEEYEKVPERERKYNSMYDATAPSEEQLEAYQILRTRDEDPMAKYLDKDNV